MKKNEVEILNKTVIQANPLIEARKEMNVTEMRLFVLGLQGVKPHIKDDTVYDVDFRETLISTNQLIGLLGQTYGSITNLKKQLEKAYDSKIILNYKNGGFEFKHIYEEMKYIPEQGLIIKFDNKMKPYILELVGQPYTKYKVKALFSLSSAYAWRILELLLAKQGYFKKGYQDVYIEYEIKQLREVLNVKNDLYKLVNNLRRRVLDEPIKEINDKTDYFVWYDVLREGRKIKGFRLWMKVKKNLTETDKKEIAPPAPVDRQSVIERAMAKATTTEPIKSAIDIDNTSMQPQEEEDTEEKKHWSDQQQADYDMMLKHGVWAQMAQKYIATYDHARIERNIQGVLRSNPKGNIRDIGAVMANAIAHDTYLDEAEEKAKAQARAIERAKAEAIKAEKELIKNNERREKNAIKNEELAKIRANKSKNELVETFEKVLSDYQNNNKILTEEMRAELAVNGIPKTDFSLYQSETMRTLIKYI